MVEWDRLEHGYAFTGIGGSNPSPTAILKNPDLIRDFLIKVELRLNGTGNDSVDDCVNDDVSE